MSIHTLQGCSSLFKPEKARCRSKAAASRSNKFCEADPTVAGPCREFQQCPQRNW